MTGRGFGHCVVPIENISGYRMPNMHQADTYAAQQRPSGIRSYDPNQSGSLPSRFSLRGGAVYSVSVLEAIFLEEAVDLEEGGRRSKNVRRSVGLYKG
jgi:hypothetical protein